MSLKSLLEISDMFKDVWNEHVIISKLPADHEECYHLLKEYVSKGQITNDFFIRQIEKLTNSKSAQQYLKLKAFW